MYIERTDNMLELFPAPPFLTGEGLCLRPLTLSDTEDLRKLTQESAVYRYLPTFLFEKKYEPAEVTRRLFGREILRTGGNIRVQGADPESQCGLPAASGGMGQGNCDPGAGDDGS